MSGDREAAARLTSAVMEGTDAGFCIRLDDVRLVLAERAALRQAVWDAYGILGFDQDGDATPDALAHPPLPDFLRQFAAEARLDADEALNEAKGAP